MQCIFRPRFADATNQNMMMICHACVWYTYINPSIFHPHQVQCLQINFVSVMLGTCHFNICSQSRYNTAHEMDISKFPTDSVFLWYFMLPFICMLNVACCMQCIDLRPVTTRSAESCAVAFFPRVSSAPSSSTSSSSCLMSSNVGLTGQVIHISTVQSPC